MILQKTYFKSLSKIWVRNRGRTIVTRNMKKLIVKGKIM